jgi:hypothetical protein
MNNYVPLAIWLISCVICIGIAKNRKIKPTLCWRLAVVFLGPLAIPALLLAKPHAKTVDSIQQQSFWNKEN